MRKHQRGS